MREAILDYDRLNFTFSTDWHLSAVPPGRRRDDYGSAILRKIGFVSELTGKIGGISLCGGDVFHIKNAKSPANEIGLLADAILALFSFPTGKVYGSVGNHDLAWGERMDSLSGQPLGLLVAAGAYFDLSKEPTMFRNSDGTIRVEVASFPYAHGEETLERLRAYAPAADATHHVAIVHAYGAEGGGGMLWNERQIGHEEICGLGYDFVLWGHDHAYKPPSTCRCGKTWHVHCGSLARAALDMDQADRPVRCHVLSFSAADVRQKEMEIPAAPLEVVFAMADKAAAKDRSEAVKEFLAQMEEAVEGIESSDPAEALKALCPDDPKLLALARQLCGL